MGHKRSIFWSNSRKWPKIDLKSAQNQPKMRISKIILRYQLAEGADPIWGQKYVFERAIEIFVQKMNIFL